MRRRYKATLFGTCFEGAGHRITRAVKLSRWLPRQPPVENSGYRVMPPSTKMLVPVM
jgi:hypothetical protein